MRKIVSIICVAAILLTGCSSLKEDATIKLTIQQNFSTFSYDLETESTVVCALYFLDSSTGRLVAENREITSKKDERSAQKAIEYLLEGPANKDLAPVNCGTSFKNIEFSENICNVYLTANTMPEDQNAYLLCSAIANTLTDMYEVEYICVFINGEAQGVGSLMREPFEKTTGIIQEEYLEKKRIADRFETNPDEIFETNAILYFLDESGKYILPEVRTIRYTPNTYLEVLTNEVAAGPKNKSYLSGPLKQANLSNYTITMDQNQINITFEKYPFNYTNDFENGEKLCVSALNYTLKGMAKVSTINLQVGNVKINTQSDSNVLGKKISILFSDKNYSVLSSVDRTVSQEDASKIETKLKELLKGPTAIDSPEIWPTLPSGISEKDILGFYINNDLIILNISENFKNKIAELNEDKERIMVFSIVNTLVQSKGIKKVLFLVEGNRIDYITGRMYYGDPFVMNPGLIRNRT